MSRRSEPPTPAPTTGGGGGPWVAIRLRCADAAAERLLALLPPECLGVHVEAVRAGRCTIRAYFAAEREVRRAIRAIDEGLGEGRVDRGEPEPVADGRWVERFQQGLRPFPLGRRFEVRPDGSTGDGERIALRLVPGRAFGTGEHPTTRLAAEALERHVRPGARWLDLGTGTGILAMVAAHRGAGEIVGVDVDPTAVKIARRVLRRNGLDDRVSVREGSLEAAGPGPWDGVAANVTAPFFLERAPDIAAALRPGGLLLATGIPEPEADAVSAVLQAAGVEPLERGALRGWSLLTARRAGRA